MPLPVIRTPGWYNSPKPCWPKACSRRSRNGRRSGRSGVWIRPGGRGSRQLGWLQRAGFQGVRLHLGLSLNHLCPAAFLLSYDRSPTSTERASLLALVEARITYIMDRGYVSVRLYRDLMERGAFFVIRERHNLRYRVLAALDLTLDGLGTGTLLRVQQDAIIQLTRGADRAALGGVLLRHASVSGGDESL